MKFIPKMHINSKFEINDNTMFIEVIKEKNHTKNRDSL